MNSKRYLSPKQAGHGFAHSSREQRPGWISPTYRHGPLALDAVQLLHAESGRYGEIRTLAECTWPTAQGPKRYIFPFERHYPGHDGRLPVLIDVLGDQATKLARAQAAHAAVLACPEAFDCSGVEAWHKTFIRAGSRLDNAKRIVAARYFATPGEQLAVVAALKAAGCRATVGDLIVVGRLGGDGFDVILRCLLAGCVRLADPVVPLDRDTIVIF